jgi:PKD repeat protein
MKNLYVTLFSIIFSLGLFAQVDREIVILEGGTGVTCPYCPGSAMGLQDLYDNGDPVAAIEYHNYGTGPFNTPEAALRTSYYAITGYPTMQFDGEWNQHVGGDASQSLYSTYLPFVEDRMDIQTAFTVELSGESDGDDYDIVVSVEKVGPYDNEDLTVQLVLTESEIPYTWLGMSSVDFCQRIMVPDANGTEITLEDEGDQVDVELSFTFDNSWDINTCELIAFVQDESNKYVLHGAAKMLLDLVPPEPTFLAGFYADETSLCEPPVAVDFYSDCIGDPIMWYWTFEGGYPESSLDEDPTVVYVDEGSYDVQLIVSDGYEWDTLLLEKYINVYGLPDVSWDEVEDLCNEDWDPYLLTQGNPEGGVYTGEYVTEGMYFHPSEAGVGDHVITYEFTDPNGCAASENYMVHVVNCVGVEENMAWSLEIFPNPTSGIVNISAIGAPSDAVELKVIDAVGKTVFKDNNLRADNDQVHQLDLSDLPQGLYFLTVTADEQRVTRKIFLRH